MPVVACLKMLDEPDLLEHAAHKREQVWQKQVTIRGIVEFSNHCQRNCLYCGLRRDNQELTRYRLSKEDILRAAGEIKNLGIGTVVLQSGEDPGCGREFVSGLIKRIKDELGLAVTLSLGERESGDIKAWRRAGADRYLLKMETFTQPLYTRLRPGCDFAGRLACLEDIRQAGYEAGSGLITGLPWQTRRQMAEDLVSLAQMRLDMISLSPFTPHPQTPLADYPAEQAADNLLALAYTRIHNPAGHIPVTSALSLHGQEIRNLALATACDVLMLSLTPQEVRSAYNIYPGKNLSPLTPQARARAILKDLQKNGFTCK